MIDPWRLQRDLPNIDDLSLIAQKVYWAIFYKMCEQKHLVTTDYLMIEHFKRLAALMRDHTRPSPLKSTLGKAYPYVYKFSDITHPHQMVTRSFIDYQAYYIEHLPLTIPLNEKIRFEGTFMVAKSGSGKTTLIENLVAWDMQKHACVVVMDSQGRKELLGRLAETYEHTLIDLNTPLNIFKLPRLPKDKTEAETLKIYAIEQITKIFNINLANMPFTGKQELPFKRCVELVVEIGGNIRDMQELMKPKGLENYKQHLHKLDKDARDFFNNSFDTPHYNQTTKPEIVQRLDAILSIPAFKRMLTQKDNIDLHARLQKPGLILIDTSRLGEGTKILGRLIINMLTIVAQERLESDYRLDTYFYCDEAGDYISEDRNLETIVDKFRKVRIATFWAIQREKQITDLGVLDALKHCATQIWKGPNDYEFFFSQKGKEPVVVTSPPVKRPKVLPKKEDFEYAVKVIPESHRLTFEPVRKIPYQEKPHSKDDIDTDPR